MKSLLVVIGVFIVFGFFYGLTKKPNPRYQPKSREGRAGQWNAQNEGEDPTLGDVGNDKNG